MSDAPKIMIIDDDEASVQALASFLMALGYRTDSAPLAQETLFSVGEKKPATTIISICAAMGRHFEFLQALTTSIFPKKAIIIADASIRSHIVTTCAERIANGAILEKPLNFEKLKHILEQIAPVRGESARPPHENAADFHASTLSSFNTSSTPLVAVSSIMREIYRRALVYHAVPDVAVLIEGETGVGKEIVARLIHEGSRTSERPLPLYALNCTAIPAALFEAELFGYAPGAFTGGLPGGAKGKLELAEKGTIFFDEIGDLPLELQPKLLRVIQERSFYPIGGQQLIKCRARIICATNRNLAELCYHKAFRQDLYHRLTIAHLVIPPLRERREDVRPLADFFLQRAANRRRRAFIRISPEAMRLLEEYSWPGNVRELENIIERAVLDHNAEALLPEHLHFSSALTRFFAKKFDDTPSHAKHAGTKNSPRGFNPTTLHDVEKQAIQHALEKHRFNIAAAARILKISRAALYRRMEKFGLR